MPVRRPHPTRPLAAGLRATPGVLAAGALSLAMLSGIVGLAGVPLFRSSQERGAPEVEEQRPVTYSARDFELEEKVWAILRLPDEGEVLTRPQAVSRIAALGPDVAPFLFAVLIGELSAPVDGDGAHVQPENESVRYLPEQGQILLEALQTVPARPVLEHLRIAATRDAPLDVRMVAARVLAELDDPASIELLLDIMTEIESIHLQRTFVQRPFEDALGAILTRHPGASRYVKESFSELDPAALAIVARALPEARPREGIELALALLDRDATLDALAVRKLTALVALVDPWIGEQAMQTLRGLMSHGDAELRREAAIALGTLHDTSSIDSLIGLLEYPHRGVQAGALWSLKRMSGQQLAGETKAWRAWWERQEHWLATEGVRFEQQLSDPDAALTYEAMRELSLRPLYKHRFAERLGPLVGHEDPNIARAACSMLAQLGSRRALPFLMDGLEKMDPETSAAALQALRKLTGHVELSGDRREWERTLGA